MAMSIPSGRGTLTHGDMDRTCRRAVELGLPSVAFTEHADWIRGDEAVFDAAGYFAVPRALPGVLSGAAHPLRRRDG